MIPRGGCEFYLLGQHLFSYNNQTLQHEDLGPAPWDLPLYRGACGGLHLLTEAWQTRLLALRDAGGRGLEEVWRIDLAESDRHVGWKGPERGKVNWLNLYGDDVWATSHRRTYRLDAATGQVREVRDYLLPEFLVEGGIGYALCPGEFRAMDMARGILLREGPRLSFPLGGRRSAAASRIYSCGTGSSTSRCRCGPAGCTCWRPSMCRRSGSCGTMPGAGAPSTLRTSSGIV